MEVNDKLLDFAKKHDLTFVFDGECGFGRPCVGFSVVGNYVEYNPTSFPDYNNIADLYSEKHYSIAPKDAYHKHDCMAVLVENENKEEALKQLLEWVEELEKQNVRIEKYKTGAIGMQAMLSGTTGYALVIKEKKL